MQLAGEYVVVTSGASGIGRAMAQDLLGVEAVVAIASRPVRVGPLRGKPTSLWIYRISQEVGRDAT